NKTCNAFCSDGLFNSVTCPYPAAVAADGKSCVCPTNSTGVPGGCECGPGKQMCEAGSAPACFTPGVTTGPRTCCQADESCGCTFVSEGACENGVVFDSRFFCLQAALTFECPGSDIPTVIATTCKFDSTTSTGHRFVCHGLPR